MRFRNVLQFGCCPVNSLLYVFVYEGRLNCACPVPDNIHVFNTLTHCFEWSQHQKHILRAFRREANLMITFDPFFIPVMPHMTFQDCLQGQHRSFALRDLVFEMNVTKGPSITALDVALKCDDLLEMEVLVGVTFCSDCQFCYRNNCDICGTETDVASCPFCGVTFCSDCQLLGYSYLQDCPCVDW